MSGLIVLFLGVIIEEVGSVLVCGNVIGFLRRQMGILDPEGVGLV